jgi:glycosyltransferase involved in cell wall biosynthesis
LIVGIDAFNIKNGGGVTHLVEILKVANPKINKFTKIVIWGDKKLLSKIEDRKWIDKINPIILESGLINRMFWHLYLVKKNAIKLKCDILFCPGGVSRSGFQPSVTMSRNMLPFEWKELFRYGVSIMTFKLFLIRFSQIKSFNKSDGVIFLSRYAYNIVSNIAKIDQQKIVIIPHGVNSILNGISSKKVIRGCTTKEKLFKLLYVSNIAPYKHHMRLIEAILNLRKSGHNVSLDLVGGSGSDAKNITFKIKNIESKFNFIKYHGEVEREHMWKYYLDADAFIFASSCENMPNILLEGMTSGLPIICSNMGPMPEVLGDAGEYFNPLDECSIKKSIINVMSDKSKRKKLSEQSLSKVKNFSWLKCTNKTFEFLNVVKKNHKLIE